MTRHDCQAAAQAAARVRDQQSTMLRSIERWLRWLAKLPRLADRWF
jgi:hypothetical protein